MNKPYRYEVMPSALKDIDGIMNSISAQLYAKDAALNLLNEIESSITLACENPYAASAVQEPALARKGYRKLIVKNYIVFYIPDDAQGIIHIMRVIYAARDFMKEL